MNLTESLSRRITGEIHKDEEGYQTDPMTVIAVVAITIEVIKLLHECQKNVDEATYEANNLKGVSERRMKRILRRKLGWREYWRNGHKYLRSFKKVGKDVDVKMMTKLYKENTDAFYG